MAPHSVGKVLPPLIVCVICYLLAPHDSNVYLKFRTHKSADCVLVLHMTLQTPRQNVYACASFTALPELPVVLTVVLGIIISTCVEHSVNHLVPGRYSSFLSLPTASKTAKSLVRRNGRLPQNSRMRCTGNRASFVVSSYFIPVGTANCGAD